MRIIALAVVLSFTAAPAFAADAPMATRGAVLRDAGNVRLGRIEQVETDGSVGVIVDSRYVVIPASKLSIVNGKPVTSLSKKEVSQLH